MNCEREYMAANCLTVNRNIAVRLTDYRVLTLSDDSLLVQLAPWRFELHHAVMERSELQAASM